MAGKDFKLIETMLFRGTLQHFGLHMARLEKSAGHFAFNFDEDEISEKIRKVTDTLKPGSPYKVRLLLSKEGKTEITTEIIENFPESYRITISKKKTKSGDDFLFHKTTNRDLYNSELARARENGFFDIIFINERDEVTEGAITNIYIEKEGMIITPPVSSGLLPGTIRTNLIKNHVAVEETFFMDDLVKSDEVYISNAVIGFQEISNSRDLKIL